MDFLDASSFILEIYIFVTSHLVFKLVLLMHKKQAIEIQVLTIGILFIFSCSTKALAAYRKAPTKEERDMKSTLLIID